MLHSATETRYTSQKVQFLQQIVKERHRPDFAVLNDAHVQKLRGLIDVGQSEGLLQIEIGRYYWNPIWRHLNDIHDLEEGANEEVNTEKTV